MKILIVGGGGREHAICWALRQNSAQSLTLFCAPGNAGIGELADVISIPPENHSALASFANKSNIDLTIVGPEAPLAAGIVDMFQSNGMRIVGPSKEAARLESSKAFAKDF